MEHVTISMFLMSLKAILILLCSHHVYKQALGLDHGTCFNEWC